MARYGNLKDYFQCEHIKLIHDAIVNHLNDGRQIKNPFVRSLVCIDDDRYYNAEFEIGVSVDVVDAEKATSLSFIVSVKGNLEQRFRDIKVIDVRCINKDSFPEDNILSQFILPDITENEIEDIGNKLYKICAFNDLFVNY